MQGPQRMGNYLGQNGSPRAQLASSVQVQMESCTGPQRRRFLHKGRSRKTHAHDGTRCPRCHPAATERPQGWRKSKVSTEAQLGS